MWFPFSLNIQLIGATYQFKAITVNVTGMFMQIQSVWSHSADKTCSCWFTKHILQGFHGDRCYCRHQSVNATSNADILE